MLSRISLFLALFFAVNSCGYREATYFRKYQATQQDERTAWGLCGGDFLPNGRVHPTIEREVIDCMRSRGFVTLNQYYVEDHIGFSSIRDPADNFYIKQHLEACGVVYPPETICEIFPYVFRNELSEVSSCMAERGYTPSLPRYKQGVRIFEEHAAVPKLFCLTLSPKNQRGGISLGSSRIE